MDSKDKEYCRRRAVLEAILTISFLLIFIVLTFIKFDMHFTLFVGISFLWAFIQFEFNWSRVRGF